MCRLAASMCAAPSPAEALMLAAALLSSTLPGTCHIRCTSAGSLQVWIGCSGCIRSHAHRVIPLLHTRSLALLSQDAQHLRYHKLCGVDGAADAASAAPGGIGGGGLGSRLADNTAAGLAAELKQMICIANIHNM